MVNWAKITILHIVKLTNKNHSSQNVGENVVQIFQGIIHAPHRSSQSSIEKMAQVS